MLPHPARLRLGLFAPSRLMLAERTKQPVCLLTLSRPRLTLDHQLVLETDAQVLGKRRRYRRD